MSEDERCYECGLVEREQPGFPLPFWEVHGPNVIEGSHAFVPSKPCEACGGSGLVTRIAENQRGYTDSFRDPCPAGCRDGRVRAESEVKG